MIEPAIKYSLHRAVSQKDGDRKGKERTDETQKKRTNRHPLPAANTVGPRPTIIKISMTPQY